MATMSAQTKGEVNASMRGFGRGFAYLCGVTLYFIGWLLFTCQVTGILLGSPDPRYLYHAGHSLRDLGMFAIVPGWLLLRSAAGLFPFSKRFFKWQQV